MTHTNHYPGCNFAPGVPCNCAARVQYRTWPDNKTVPDIASRERVAELEIRMDDTRRRVNNLELDKDLYAGLLDKIQNLEVDRDEQAAVIEAQRRDIRELEKRMDDRRTWNGDLFRSVTALEKLFADKHYKLPEGALRPCRCGSSAFRTDDFGSIGGFHINCLGCGRHVSAGTRYPAVEEWNLRP